jgi:hypothetical protein
MANHLDFVLEVKVMDGNPLGELIVGGFIKSENYQRDFSLPR